MKKNKFINIKINTNSEILLVRIVSIDEYEGLISNPLIEIKYYVKGKLTAALIDNNTLRNMAKGLPAVRHNWFVKWYRILISYR